MMPIRRFDRTSRSTEDLKADVLLVTVTDVETQALLQIFKEQFGRDVKRHHIGNHTYRDLGLIAGARVFVVRSQMGSVEQGASLLTVQAGIQMLRPWAVILVGIAFGVNPAKQKIGDVLVSKQIFLYNPQRIGVGPQGEPDIRSRGSRVMASTKLLDRFQDSLEDWKGAEVHFGLMLSGETLVDNPDVRNQLLRLEPEAIGGEMEGAGVYIAAQTEKVDWIVVKAICDWADGNKGENKHQNQQQAAQNAARLVIHTLQKGGFIVTISPDLQGGVVVNISPNSGEQIPISSKSNMSASQVSENSPESRQTMNSSWLIFSIFLITALTVIILVYILGIRKPIEPPPATPIATAVSSPTLTILPSVATPPPTTPVTSPIVTTSCKATRSSSSEVSPIYPDYDPSGLMGDIGDITVQKNADGVRFRYETLGRGPHEFEYKYVDGQLNNRAAQFAGVMYLSPPNNFGNQPGFDLQATHRIINWEARSISGSANVEFVIGGITWRWDNQDKKRVGVDCPDSLSRTPLGMRTLNAEWQTFEADLSNIPQEQFSNVIGGFSWIINWGSNGVELNPNTGLPKAPKTFEIEIRNIRYER